MTVLCHPERFVILSEQSESKTLTGDPHQTGKHTSDLRFLTFVRNDIKGFFGMTMLCHPEHFVILSEQSESKDLIKRPASF
jgi:hypothetical protein